MADNDVIVRAAREGAKRYRAEQQALLERFSTIDSGSRNIEGNASVNEVIEEMLSHIEGIKIERRHFDGYGDNIVAKLTPPGASGKIILNAHTDTVFNPGDCAAHPFRVEGDRAYGLGIVDCKGGIIVAIYAVRIMQEAGMLPNKEICFIFNCDEEIGSPTGHVTFDEEIPGADAAFVFEPARLEDGVLTARKGSVSIGIEVRGKRAHAGVNYLDGRSATVELASKIIKLYESNIDERGIQFNIGKLYGVETGTGVVPDYACADVGVRVANDADIATVREIVERVGKMTYIEGTESKIEIKKISVPMERSEKNCALYRHVHAAGMLLGHDLPEQSTGGSGDSSWFSCKGVPTVDALGPYMYEIHSTNESMRLSSLEEKTALFCTVLGTMR